MSVHPHAAAFDRGAEDYELGRPGYPPALLDWMVTRFGLDASATVLDLGAGTGKLTRLLCEGPARVVAVEPVAPMRRILADRLPGVELHAASAESMPLADGSIDLVACGQSFRWFATERALAEIARVLVPGGACLFVFNRDAGSGPLVARLQAMLGAADHETAERKPGGTWREVLDASRHVVVDEEVSFDNPFTVDREQLVARLHSSSQFVRLPGERQAELIAAFDAAVDRWPIDLAQITTVTATRRLGPR